MTPDIHRAIRATLLLLASAIAACGGGSGAERSSAAIQVPATLAFTLTPTAMRSFHFSWNGAAGATGYRLLEDPDGASGYAPIAELPAHITQYGHEVFLPERMNARYALQVCGDQGCVDAAELSASGPLSQAVGYFKASAPADNDRFGSGLALSPNGRFLAVGAPGSGTSNGSGGAVHVFARDGAGWRPQAVLLAPSPQAGDRFGASLAWSGEGDTLAVGAPRAGGSGTVFLFSRAGEAWSAGVPVLPLVAQPDDRFGGHVALSADGDTLAVGADGESSQTAGVNGPDDNSAKPQSGAAYVFVRAGGAWTQQAYIKASHPDFVDFFGRALALSADGQTLAVGAVGESSAARGVGGDPGDNTSVESGAVYVFALGQNGWSQQAYVKASNTRGNARFGNAIALSANGRLMAVGSASESSQATGIDGDQDNNAAQRSGAAYVFAHDGQQWGQQAYLKASNTEASDLFGASLTLSADGETLVVGASGEGSHAQGLQGDQGNNDFSGSGAAYLFRHTAAGWRQQAYIKPSNTAHGQVYDFGSALALAGHTGGAGEQRLVLAVGCPYASNASAGLNGDQTDTSGSDVGAVYLY